MTSSVTQPTRGTAGLMGSRAGDGRRLLRAGTLLFFFALSVGLAIPRFAVPRLALSTHLLGVMQGMFLLVLGLLWPNLNLVSGTSRIGSRLAVYGCLSAWTANLLAALLGAGNTMLPIAAGHARGTVVQERLIAALLVTAATCLLLTTVIVLWGLRGAAAVRDDSCS